MRNASRLSTFIPLSHGRQGCFYIIDEGSQSDQAVSEKDLVTPGNYNKTAGNLTAEQI